MPRLATADGVRALTYLGSCVLAAGLTATAPAFGDAASDRALTAAYNASGHDLFKQFTAGPGNVVLSPYSIGTAMAMAVAGARGDTEAEMIAKLHHTLPPAALAEANGDVLAILNSYGQSDTPPQQQQRPSPTAIVRSANALVLTEKAGQAVDPAYVASIEEQYAAEVFRGGGLDAINGWVKERTEGKIEKLLDRLDPDTALVLLNAVYFKAAWLRPFAKTATADAEFHLTPAETVQVPTMHQTARVALIEQADYRAIRLPYAIDTLAMVIVVPNDIDGADALVDRLDAEAVTKLSASFGALTNTKLSLPRFKIQFKASLVEPFEAIGLRLPFDPQHADFSAIIPSGAPTAIDQIVHSAVIEVTEEGTEAAAATAVSIAVRSLPTEPVAFKVDRPFLFYLTDDKTGAILFQGLIRDPRAS